MNETSAKHHPHRHSPAGSVQDSRPTADPARWRRYFDELEVAVRAFEVGLSQGRVEPLTEVEIPLGHPPDELRGRSGDLYMRVSELEYRARFLREELRAESARLPRGRTRSGGKAEWNYGTAIDINT